MKSLRRIPFILACLSAIGFIWFLCRIFFVGGTKAKDIISAVGLDMPNYEIVTHDDNLMRGASRWDWFMYIVSFSTEDVNSLIESLKNKGWEEYNNAYFKTVEVDEDLIYSAHVFPTLGRAKLEVEIDETYSMFDYLMVIVFAIPTIIFGLISFRKV